MNKEALEQIRKKLQDIKSACARHYVAGLIDKPGLHRELAELHTMFDDGFEELGLQKVSPPTAESMKRYEEDYRLWASGNKPVSTVGEPWLLRQATGSEHVPVEATADERAAYFDLAREALVEISVGDMPPDDMEKPVRHIRVYGNGDRVVVPFDCADDGGLLACEDPRGHEFTLTDSKGLHVVIEVDARAGFEYRPTWEKGSQYHGLISVEGYTVSGLHSVGTVEKSAGKISSVTYYNKRFVSSDAEYADRLCTAAEYEAARNACARDKSFFTIVTAQGERNEEAFRAFPRWQPYFEWLRTHPPKTLSPTFEDYVSSVIEMR